MLAQFEYGLLQKWETIRKNECLPFNSSSTPQSFNAVADPFTSTHSPPLLTHFPLPQIAKGNTDASLSTRASAAKDALGDKMNESKSAASAELNKEKAKN